MTTGPRYILEPGAERPRREEPATSAGQVRMAVEALTAFQAAQARAEHRERWLIVGVLLAVVATLFISMAMVP